jgi:hypothetical protein
MNEERAWFTTSGARKMVHVINSSSKVHTLHTEKPFKRMLLIVKGRR